MSWGRWTWLFEVGSLGILPSLDSWPLSYSAWYPLRHDESSSSLFQAAQAWKPETKLLWLCLARDELRSQHPASIKLVEACLFHINLSFLLRPHRDALADICFAYGDQSQRDAHVTIATSVPCPEEQDLEGRTCSDPNNRSRRRLT